jgi:hypothetical protein
VIAAPALAASASVDHLAGLWLTYQAARDQASELWQQWHMMKAIARTDGTAGLLYGQAYGAEQVADTAYEAYLAAQRAQFGDRG